MANGLLKRIFFLFLVLVYRVLVEIFGWGESKKKQKYVSHAFARRFRPRTSRHHTISAVLRVRGARTNTFVEHVMIYTPPALFFLVLLFLSLEKIVWSVLRITWWHCCDWFGTRIYLVRGLLFVRSTLTIALATLICDVKSPSRTW